jgi:16S rRNA processing protein RimM
LRPFAELVTIGRVIKPQGRQGEVLAESLSDRPDRFPSLAKVYLRGPRGTAQEYRVLGCRPHKGRFALKLSGVDSIDAAERLRGSELGIVEGELLELPPGSYYYHELVGLAALDDAGRPLGVVDDILETGAVPVLQIVAGARERLVPLAQPFIGAIDLRARTLRVHDAPEHAAV